MNMKPNKPRSFLQELFGVLINVFGRLFAAFSIGTGATALVFMYYGVPIVFSLIGGFIVLGIAVALMSETPFF